MRLRLIRKTLLFFALVLIVLGRGIGVKPVQSATSTPLPPVGVGTYDDDDTNIVYTGTWIDYSNVNAYNGGVHYSETINNTASLTFLGNRAMLIFSRYTDRGIMDIEIDGVIVDSLNQYGSTLEWQQVWNSSVLLSGMHTLRLIHANGPIVDVGAVIVNEAPPTPTNTFMPTASNTPVPPTPTDTLAPTATNTPAPSTPTDTLAPTATNTPVPPTPTDTLAPTATNTPTPSTPTNTLAPTASNTPVPTSTPGSRSLTSQDINFGTVMIPSITMYFYATPENWNATDSTESGSGWNITIAADDFISSDLLHNMPANNMSVQITGFTFTDGNIDRSLKPMQM